MVGNDSSTYLKVFVEVSKPLSAEMGDILISRPKFRNCARIIQYNYYRKISIFAIFANYHYPVSYNVVKAYKVILGLIFRSAWTKTCKVLACFARNGSFAWRKLVGNVVFSFDDIPGTWHLLRIVRKIVLFKCM